MPYGFAPAIGEGVAIERVTQRTPRPHHTYTTPILRTARPPLKRPTSARKGQRDIDIPPRPSKSARGAQNGATRATASRGEARTDGQSQNTRPQAPAPCHRARALAPCALPVMLPRAPLAPCHGSPPHATPRRPPCALARMPRPLMPPPYAPRLLAPFTRPTDATPAPLFRA
jgi:hypothetical protein